MDNNILYKLVLDRLAKTLYLKGGSTVLIDGLVLKLLHCALLLQMAGVVELHLCLGGSILPHGIELHLIHGLGSEGLQLRRDREVVHQTQIEVGIPIQPSQFVIISAKWDCRNKKIWSMSSPCFGSKQRWVQTTAVAVPASPLVTDWVAV